MNTLDKTNSIRITNHEIYYFRSILRQLYEIQNAITDKLVKNPSEFLMIGYEVLADNIDWLDCWIENQVHTSHDETEVIVKRALSIAADACVPDISRRYNTNDEAFYNEGVNALRTAIHNIASDPIVLRKIINGNQSLNDSNDNTQNIDMNNNSDELLQPRVAKWMQECFGPEISNDKLERGDRLLEEVFELLQSGDYPKERINLLMHYVWGREKGEPFQEVGGVMITLAAYCLAHGLDMHTAGNVEMSRITTPENILKIRAKQAAKPTGSALPIAMKDISDLHNTEVNQNSNPS